VQDGEEAILSEMMPTAGCSRAASAAGAGLIAEVLRRFGDARVRALGTSMLPALQPGDVLHVRRCGIGDVREGDIVLSAAGARLLAHRVVRVSTDPEAPFVVTRGDDLPADDLPIRAAQMLGVVVAASRRGRELRAPFPAAQRGDVDGWRSKVARAWAVALYSPFA
jgi:hypothetical protein